MISASLDTEKFAEKLKIFSSGLGYLFNDLLKEVGDKMTIEARAAAPRRTGRLAGSIGFLLPRGENLSALTTRKSMTRGNVRYANPVEHGSTVEAKNREYLMFKIDGEWKKVKKTNPRPPRPFMHPVFDKYFGGDRSTGYRELSAALLGRIEEEVF